MNDATIFNVRLPNQLFTEMERTSTGRDLDEALDAWLADDFAHEDYLHVHSWNDDEQELQPMSRANKTYRVRFSVRDFYSIEIKARSEDHAIAKAEDLYSVEGEAPFSFDLSEGGTGDWDAEEVVS